MYMYMLAYSGHQTGHGTSEDIFTPDLTVSEGPRLVKGGTAQAVLLAASLMTIMRP